MSIFKKEETWEEWAARKRPFIDADIPRQREEEKKALKSFEESLVKECEAFKFRAERYGDHLALFIEGLNAPKELHAVRVGNPSTISLRPGHAPDMQGWKVAQISTSNGKETIWWHEEYCPPFYRQGYGPGGGRFLVTDPKPDPQSSNMMYGGQSYVSRMDGCARPSEHDRIRFNAAGATLFVPFGLGETIYQSVLAALAMEPPP